MMIVMFKRIVKAVAVVTATAMLWGCGQKEILPRDSWSDDAYTKLTELISSKGSQSRDYDASVKPYAVFDCDNTTIIGDIEQQLYFYQVSNLRYKIQPGEFASTLLSICDDPDLPINGDITIAQFVKDVSADYQYLYANYIGVEGGDLETIKKSPEYMDFTAKMIALYDGIDSTLDYGTACQWVSLPLSGLTYAELDELCNEAFTHALTMGGTRDVAWISPDMGVCGQVISKHKEGLIIPERTKHLYQALRDNGFDVYICSASFEPIVEAFACSPDRSLGMTPEWVYGLRWAGQSEPDTIIDATQMDSTYIQTYKQGKTDAIKAYIAPSHSGRGPALVAGDSNGDYSMLTSFDDMQLGIIIDCGNTGPIGELASTSSPRYATQPQ